MTRTKTALIAALLCGISGCGYAPLEPRPDEPEQRDDLPGAITIEGVQVLPAVIHPGDQVTLRDPVQASPGDPIPLYYWDACAGSVEQQVLYSRQATWLAPSQAGTYSVTMNVTNAFRDQPSRVLRLCVVAEGESSCPGDAGPAPSLHELKASPSLLQEGKDCAGNCVTTLSTQVSSPGAEPIEQRWAVREGSVSGTGSEVQWRLPTAGCCTEVYTAALTSCDARANAVTGFVDVTVEPE